MKTTLWLCVVVATATYITTPIGDPDLWWHITIGKWILHHHDVPSVDYWTLFGSGERWRAYSWSNEIVFALVDRLWGIHGLLVAKICLALLIAFSFAFCLGSIARDWFV